MWRKLDPPSRVGGNGLKEGHTFRSWMIDHRLYPISTPRKCTDTYRARVDIVTKRLFKHSSLRVSERAAMPSGVAAFPAFSLCAASRGQQGVAACRHVYRRRWRLRAVAGSGGGLEVAWEPLTHRRSGAVLAWRQAQRIGTELERRPKDTNTRSQGIIIISTTFFV